MIAPTTAETILVVDDDSTLCELIGVILGCAGYRVLTATTGDNALNIAGGHGRIDLLLCDIELPDLHGEELARRFAGLHPTASVAFISGRSKPVDASPSSLFLAKPFTVSELRNAVRRALHARQPASETASAA